MAWIFGKKKKAEPEVTPQSAVESNARKLEDIQKKIDQLDRKAEAEAKKAVAFAKAKNKKKALECMKRKKVYENHSAQLSNMAFNLEQQQHQLQMASISADAFQQYAQNTKALKTAMVGLDSDKIDELRDQNADAVDQLNEINEILAAPTDPTADDDAENDLEDLLAQMEEEGDEEPAAKVKPSAAAAADDDDEEIGNLMANFG